MVFVLPQAQFSSVERENCSVQPVFTVKQAHSERLTYDKASPVRTRSPYSVFDSGLTIRMNSKI